ncbi:MAG: carboxypeptidase-like regulatory domain-containing protein [Bacteroidales bacterium]|nr:carboxypeptidase-like regulatory domain-containing protein [Bacteroidales bacterium]
MRKYLILIAFLVCSTALFAQVDSVRLGYSVHGTVVDAATGRPMESVHVSVPDRHYATVTNADGGFTIKSDQPVSEVVFSYMGYRTQSLHPTGQALRVRLLSESLTLEEASIITGDPYEIVRAAIDKIPDRFSRQPELLECFYRETVRKRNRYIYVSEAVARMYKTGYDGTIYRDRTALEKSRVLLSQRKADTLSVKVQGGPTQAMTFDVVKNFEILFDKDEMALYEFEMGMPTYINDRLQFVIRFRPGYRQVDWALYNGTLYIDRELLSFTRIEMSLDMSDINKATRMMVIRKPLTLRLTPRELSVVINYRLQDGKSRLSYFRSTMRFNCDWRKRLFATSYAAVNELVVTDVREPAVPIARADAFRTIDILSDKAAEFLDPDYWKDYNIIEPTESLENAIGRLRKGR